MYIQSIYLSVWRFDCVNWDIFTLTRTKVTTITSTRQQKCIFVCEFFDEKWLIQASKQKINIKLHTPRHSQWLSVIVFNISTTVYDCDSECVNLCSHARISRENVMIFAQYIVSIDKFNEKEEEGKNQTKKILWAQHTTINKSLLFYKWYFYFCNKLSLVQSILQ